MKGYLQIGDDTLLNTWELFNVERDVMWIPEGFTTIDANVTKHKHSWYWWNSLIGRQSFLRAMADLEHISGLSEQYLLQGTKASKTFSQICNEEMLEIHKKNSPRCEDKSTLLYPRKQDAKIFLTNYYKIHDLAGKARHRAIDLFYIPQVAIHKFITFAQHFYSHNVIIELALPTIHYGLAGKISDVKYVKATSLWGVNRSNVTSLYSQSTFFLHPFKFNLNMNHPNGRNFLCKVFIETLLSNAKKIKNSPT